MKVGREAWMPSEGRLSRKRIGPVRQRNDESRDPTQWASDSAKARGFQGGHAYGPIGGWFIGGQVSCKAITTEPDHRLKSPHPITAPKTPPQTPYDSVYIPKLTLLFARQSFTKIIICKNNSVPTYIQAIWSAKFQSITA